MRFAPASAGDRVRLEMPAYLGAGLVLEDQLACGGVDADKNHAEVPIDEVALAEGHTIDEEPEWRANTDSADLEPVDESAKPQGRHRRGGTACGAGGGLVSIAAGGEIEPGAAAAGEDSGAGSDAATTASLACAAAFVATGAAAARGFVFSTGITGDASGADAAGAAGAFLKTNQRTVPAQITSTPTNAGNNARRHGFAWAEIGLLVPEPAPEPAWSCPVTGQETAKKGQQDEGRAVRPA